MVPQSVRSISDVWDDELVYSQPGETQLSHVKPEIDPINVGGIEVGQSSEEEEAVIEFDRSRRSRFSDVWD